MSDDPKQEYFSDGITVSIITALSKVEKLFVIARTPLSRSWNIDIDCSHSALSFTLLARIELR